MKSSGILACADYVVWRRRKKKGTAEGQSPLGESGRPKKHGPHFFVLQGCRPAVDVSSSTNSASLLHPWWSQEICQLDQDTQALPMVRRQRPMDQCRDWQTNRSVCKSRLSKQLQLEACASIKLETMSNLGGFREPHTTRHNNGALLIVCSTGNVH